MTQKLQIAAQLAELRDTMKRLYGATWSEVTKEYRCTLTIAMQRTGNDNPLLVVLPLAKSMKASGHNPALLLAVAADMASD